jgi:hypothetical protein
MYCAACGHEVGDVEYCPNCGHELGTSPIQETETREESAVGTESDGYDGVDYDFVMSVEDAIRRRTPLRLFLDVVALIVTAGFWAGWLAMEIISHHYNLKKGKTKPWEEGDEQTFNIL